MRWLVALLACTGCDVVYGLTGRGDAAVQGDASGDASGDGGVPVACNDISMLADTFDVDSLASRWFGSYGGAGALSVSGGNLVLFANQANDFVTLDSGAYYDVRDRSFTAKITDDQGISDNSYVHVTLESTTPERAVSIQRTAGQLRFVVFEGGSQSVLSSIPFVGIQHAYLRIAFAGNDVAFATSADGTTWTQQATRPIPEIGFAKVRIATYRASAAGPFRIYVEEIGAGPASQACPLAQLRDDFSAATLDRSRWGRSSAYSGQLLVDNGEILALAQPAMNVPASVTLGAAQVYRLQDSEIAVELPQMVMADSRKTFALSINVPGGDSISMTQAEGVLSGLAFHQGLALNPFAMPFNATTMRWWRIRNASGATHWEVSSNGMVWASLASTAALEGLDRVIVDMRVSSSATDEDLVKIDNVNVLP